MSDPDLDVPPTIDERLGEFVSLQRDLVGLSQTELGSRLDPPLSRQGIGHLERGRVPWTVARWNDVLVALGLPSPVEQLPNRR